MGPRKFFFTTLPRRMFLNAALSEHACIDSAAPRLKDAKLSIVQLEESYAQCVMLMRTMFHKCRLVHADLSEYNILYADTVSEYCALLLLLTCFPYRFYENGLYFIDVSQSVEHDHPMALDFLRMDCGNVTDFFRRQVLLYLLLLLWLKLLI